MNWLINKKLFKLWKTGNYIKIDNLKYKYYDQKYNLNICECDEQSILKNVENNTFNQKQVQKLTMNQNKNKFIYKIEILKQYIDTIIFNKPKYLIKNIIKIVNGHIIQFIKLQNSKYLATCYIDNGYEYFICYINNQYLFTKIQNLLLLTVHNNNPESVKY